ncbi:hypothetical protein DFJ63DRAFT_287079 [Scheffersomyces coipomensis]|uniref:uncharacterized protein n=1 Tax=Scheffersomyces coipomensis TaxID=1788519 RepID=UPI00315C6367
MSSLKKALKAAKSAIESNDPVSALEYVDEALEFDDTCYFAYIFQGKSYQLLDDISKATTSFEKATELEPENLLGWKGFIQVAKSGKDYKLFFFVITKLIELSIDQGISIAESLRDIKSYLDTNQYKTNQDLYEFYLRSILPSSELGELVGKNLGTAESNLRTLIDLVKTKLNKELTGRLAKERVKFGRVLTIEQKSYLNNISWTYYNDSDLESLYESFLNISNDDVLRRSYEEEYLKHKYEVLKVSPNKDDLIQDIKEMVDGMILIKTKSQFCWDLYFNWLDVKSLGDIEIENIIFYLNNFSNKGLGGMLFALSMSDISPFDKEKIIEGISSSDKFENKKEEKKIEFENEEEEKILQSIEDDDFEVDKSQYNLLPDQVLSLMIEGFEHASDSVLANRIIIDYYIHLREYAVCSERCREGIKLLADLQRSLGINLKNTREEMLCSLAIVYTYYEAPKNFSRALQLYDKVLEDNATNVKARIGKGLILAEEQDFNAAKDLLQKVVEEYPDNVEAAVEFNWCLIRLKDYTKGREGLIASLDSIKGADFYSKENRAIIHWRIAKGLITEDDSDSSKIDQAYNHLVSSLKESQSYAPAYTLLGIVLQVYYGDRSRGQKCFYKAVELDVVEVTAAKYLVEEVTDKNDWNIAEVLCKRLIESDTARRLLLSKNYEDEDRSWPFRVLGCSALNKQDDAKAVEWFQSALRYSSVDVSSWTGLGEAYFNSGRYDAAVKVFTHVLELSPDSWVSKHLLGLTYCRMGEFLNGFEILEEVLESRPEEECILSALYEGYIEYTKSLVAGGFFGRSVESNLKAINIIHQAFKVNKSSQNLWKSLADSVRIFLIVGENIDKFPIDVVHSIFKEVGLADFKPIEGVTEDDGYSLENAVASFEAEKYTSALSSIVVLCSKASIIALSKKASRFLTSIVYYNLGLSYLEAFNLSSTDNDRDLSTKYLKKAIQLEGRNSLFWIALGNSYVTNNPEIAQHCFIKASTLDSKNVGVWTNLAALYLYCGDIELAQETFLRAQSVAPQESQSWLGHALTADAFGDKATSSRLFTHAFILSNGRSSLAQFLYGLSILTTRSTGSDIRDSNAIQEFSVANQAITKYLKYAPNDEIALEISISIAERCRDYNVAAEVGNRLCDNLEKKYEESEEDAVLIKFANAKTQLSRIYLGLKKFAEAIENAQFAIDLIGDGDDKNTIILSSRITIGLSLFFNNEFEASLEQLSLILKDYHDSKRLVTLVSQILYANGTEESKKAAIDQLFTFIEENGSSLLVVLTLGAISIVDNLDEYLGAIKEELQGLSLEEYINDSHRSIPQLLEEINDKLDSKDGSDRVWQQSALLFPSDFNVWRNLNTEMALAIASTANNITTSQLSEAYLDNGKLREIQRSILLSPHKILEYSQALENCF